MGIARGPNIVKDNLVFGYDTGYGVADNNTATRFYPGKPTTNLLTQSGAQSLDVRTDIYSNTTKTDLGGGKYKFVNDGTGGSTIRLYTNVNDLVDGSTYGCSVSYENFNPGDGTALFLDWCDNNVTTFSKANYGSSNRIFMSGTKSTYNSTYRFLDITLPINSSIVLFDAQVELSTPSPYTDDSRSSTQSLIDLKRTADIDVSNVSFDSTGQPEFDGTNDYIGLSSLTSLWASDFTINFIAKTDSTANQFIFSNGSYGSAATNIWFGGGNNTNLAVHLRKADGTGATGYNFTLPSEYTAVNSYSIVYSSSGNTLKLYQNSTLIESKNTSGVDPSWMDNGWRIGNTAGSYNLNGNIYKFSVYNRILSAQEIKQNYNAYKNRFNI